jgi:hypothetical protein
VTLPPIVPGPDQPEEYPPTYQYPAQYSAPPAQPVPVYYQPPAAPAFNPTRTAGNTLVVVLVLVGIFCVLPALICAGIVLLGSFSGGGISR